MGIFVNNIEVSLMAIGGGFTFGVLTVYSLAYNGALPAACWAPSSGGAGGSTSSSA